MDALQVLVAKPDGSTAFEDVFMFSHQQAAGSSPFVALTTADNRTVAASPGHYLPVSKAGQGYAHATPVRAADIKAGDTVWTLAAAGMSPAAVTYVTRTTMPGLYNPHTASGTIIVDGVAAFTFTDTLPPSIVAHTLATAFPRLLFACFKAAGLQALLGPVNSVLLHLYHHQGMSGLVGGAAALIASKA